MGGVRNGAAEEDWCWDLNPGEAAMPGEGHEALAERGPCCLGKREDHISLGCSFLPRTLGSRRDFARKKRRGERTRWRAMRMCHMALD